jgi:hypothetical protein
MLDSYNPTVRLVRTARERLVDNSDDHYNIRIFFVTLMHMVIYLVSRWHQRLLVWSLVILGKLMWVGT